ncbi:TPA: hypothetical protein NQI33_003736 [Salmonella enterica subsp. enterica serovar Infantis]|uniref:Inner membrane protein n=2 Tax=Salmonella enterica I TaxID=59201 RepID=A0A5R1YLA9_SALIN|nr:hypothetical protein [Salmonella enterica]EAA2613481.1 hypothetical protein [Salmonella enterica subsp. enterica serovar Virchow]EBH8067794.1 hypothetical protein [Salmonella bongori]EBL1801109.1 hypothetical protein [Salmonella enterica subsp. enterica serovar Rubislaw]EDS3575037.1 hypothetical protein [Salmonella enterica subsp. enterica serovar Sangera]EDU5885944.1 hypothetical protein [Salmonella enterica subsp. enterica serovar Hillingdon]HCL0936580.1 hypothetical protein [Salmonella 
MTSFISSIAYASSSLNKQLSLLSENLPKEKIISFNIFCSISTYSRINVRRWRKNLMSRNTYTLKMLPQTEQNEKEERLPLTFPPKILVLSLVKGIRIAFYLIKKVC